MIHLGVNENFQYQQRLQWVNQIITFNSIFFIMSVKQVSKNLELAVIEERTVNEIFKETTETNTILFFLVKYYFRSYTKNHHPSCSKFYSLYSFTLESTWYEGFFYLFLLSIYFKVIALCAFSLLWFHLLSEWWPCLTVGRLELCVSIHYFKGIRFKTGQKPSNWIKC